MTDLPSTERIRQLLLTRFNAIFAVIILVFGITTYSMTRLYGAPAYFTTSYYSTTLHYATGFFILTLAIYRAVYIMTVERPERLTRAILKDLHGYVSWERALFALPLLLLTPLFFSLFTTAKNMIPFINPFSWDSTLSEWDRMLHFGRHPWEWLQPILGMAGITLFISFFYKMWFFIKFSVMYWQMFSLKNPSWREDFFVALLLTWIINGVVLATLLSSVGPCYYGLLLPDSVNPYAELMSYLRETQIFDLPAQEYLWAAYTSNASAPFSGISAAPSMHVSVACLYALLGWRYGGLIRWGFLAFLLITFIGSIHLGWHYAVDGYISLVTTPIIWWVTVRLLHGIRARSSAVNLVPAI